MTYYRRKEKSGAILSVICLNKRVPLKLARVRKNVLDPGLERTS